MAYDVVRKFEKEIAEYAGAKYGVSCSSLSNAVLLSCIYHKVGEVTIPSRTYPSVPMAIKHAGGKVKFVDYKWSGVYELEPYGIIDGALRFKRGMYKGGLHCLSFHMKKHIPIGRGGMILTDDPDAVEWLKKARFDGRTEGIPLHLDTFDVLGYNVYMTPDQAARGLQYFKQIENQDLPDMKVWEQGYPDLSKFDIFK